MALTVQTWIHFKLLIFLKVRYTNLKSNRRTKTKYVSSYVPYLHTVSLSGLFKKGNNNEKTATSERIGSKFFE